MRLIFEKRIDLYKRFLKEESLTELDRLRLENKREWTMSHLLNLIIEKGLRIRITDLTKRVYRLEKADGPDYRLLTAIFSISHVPLLLTISIFSILHPRSCDMNFCTLRSISLCFASRGNHNFNSP
jgi:hypothetical protein